MVTMASNGTALLSVVTKASPSAIVATAAADLAEKLSAITGTEFAVTTGDGSTGIAVGLGTDFAWPLSFTPSDPTKTEDYTLRSHAGGIYVGGATDAGVKHAIWGLLHHIGYRQFFPGDAWEVVPSIPELDVNINVVESPDWYGRRFGIHYRLWEPNEPRVAAWNQRNRMGQGITLNTGHSYAQIVSRNEAEFDAHPEYYAEIDGVRDTEAGEGVKFDISNADLRQLVVDDTLALFAADPNRQSASLDPTDGGGWGNSAAELALGSISDRVVTLANQTMEAVDAAYPDQKWIGIYAYNQHSPPPNISVNPRVVVSIATRFVTGGHTVDSLIAGWSEKGATLGIREYYSVNVWDRDLPGKAKAANTERLRSTIRDWNAKGARWMTSETGDGWGPAGLGYYLAARYLWSRAETANHDALIADFLTRCFAPALEPMREFFEIIDGANRPLLSHDLIGRMYLKLRDALDLTEDTAIRRRIYDLVLYARYVELFRDYELSVSTNGERQVAFEVLLRFAYQISVHNHMVHSYALWRDLEKRDENVAIPFEARYSVPEPDNPWKSSEVIPDAEMDGYIADGIANHPLLDFTPLEFSDDLIPATALGLTTPGALGEYTYIRGENFYHTWAETAPAQIPIRGIGGKSSGTEGDLKFELYPREEPEFLFVDSAQIPPDNTPYDLTFDTDFSGLQSLRVSDGGGGYEVNPNAPDAAFTYNCGLHRTTRFTGRWTMYFYVPKGTTVVGGYQWGASGTFGTDTLRDGDGNIVYTFVNVAGYWHVPVPEGQDGKLWRFNACINMRALMTVPPYVARSADELLLPREVLFVEVFRQAPPHRSARFDANERRLVGATGGRVAFAAAESRVVR
jgi:hypothetical protein